MPELHSEDEEDPLSWEKYLASLARKEQAHAESLQHLAPLPNTPKSAPESQANNIADTPEVESKPAEAHELTGEGTTDATDPTTSDGFTEGDEGDSDIDYDKLEVMYCGAPMCRTTGVRVSSCLRLQNITQCQAHPPPHWTSLRQALAWHWMHPRQAHWRPCWMSLRQTLAQHRMHLQQRNFDFSRAQSKNKPP